MRIEDCGLRIARRLGALIIVIALVGPPPMAATEGEHGTLMVVRSTLLDTGPPIAVVSLLQIRDAAARNQVLLRVRFAEVNRTALTQLGATWFSDGAQNTVGSVTTQQFSTPFFDQNKAMVGEHQVFSDYLNLFLFDFKHNIGAVVKALQSRGLLQTLAEPNLVAESGKEASFLAGGAYPLPIAQP